MSHSFTRQGLYERVWTTPMTKLADELSIPASRLRDICHEAAIPTPSSGYWVQRDFGKAGPSPLGPAPEGFEDSIDLAARHRKPSIQPKVRTSPLVAVEPQAAPPQPKAPPVRPTATTSITRQVLHEAVWGQPMSRLAQSYGVSDVGLAKICAKADIPCPPRGYWARKAASQPVKAAKLPRPERSQDVVTIHPTPILPPPPQLSPEASAAVNAAREVVLAEPVPNRLVRPHPLIAKWLTDHEAKKREARRERDPVMRSIMDPGEFTASVDRRHRVLDALFKGLERSGAKISETERGQLVVEVQGERVEFQLREKHKQGRRPLTPDELRWRSPGSKDWKQELVPTGRLAFEVKTRLPGNLTSQWTETDASPLESLVLDIVSTLIAAGPLLVQQRQAKGEAERQRQIAEHLRHQEQQRRKCEKNRLRRFTELARDWRELAVARDFLEVLKARPITSTELIDGRSLDEWLAWADERLRAADPLANGVAGVFRDVGTIKEWSYRD